MVVLLAVAILFFTIQNLLDLAVSGHPAADDPEQGKNGNQDTFCAQQSIQVKADKETKRDASRHCQSNLHYDLQVGGPSSIIFKVEKHFRWP